MTSKIERAVKRAQWARHVDHTIGNIQRAMLLDKYFYIKTQASCRNLIMPESFSRIEEILLGKPWLKESELQVAFIRFGDDLDVVNYGQLRSDLEPIFKCVAALLGWPEDDEPEEKPKDKLKNKSRNRSTD